MLELWGPDARCGVLMLEVWGPDAGGVGSLIRKYGGPDAVVVGS